MAKRRPSEDTEIPFVALMDTMTNVVGVLIIVLVLVGLGVAGAVKKILSELPPVTVEQLAKLKETITKKETPPDPKTIDEQATEAEKQIKKAIEELKTLDLSPEKQKLADIDNLEKQLADRKKDRDAKKKDIEKLIAELDAMKARLDQTPVYKPEAGTVVRLPNPRPYPEKPVETRVLVAKEGILFYREAEYLDPVLAGLEQVKSQLTYKDVKIEPFAAMLEKILGTKAEVQKAWPDIAPLVNTFQMDLVAQAYKNLTAGGVVPTKDMLQRLGDISIVLRQTLPDVATAVAVATKGDLTKWVAMDPAKAPAVPIIRAAKYGNKITFSYGAKSEEVRDTPRDVLGYFKTLSDMDGFKNAGKNKVIYDAFKIVEMLKKAAASQVITKTYTMEPAIRPGLPYVQLTLTPRAGSGETIAQFKQPNSNSIRALRAIKNDPNGVAVFQVMPEAIPTYLEARKLADEVEVPATWEFLATLNLTANVTTFEVQRFTIAAPRRPAPAAGTPAAVTIPPPKKTLD